MKIAQQKRLLRLMRRGTTIFALGMALYMGQRFDLLKLPELGCSPVSRFSPGARLLVDRRPPEWRSDDCVFVASSDGAVHLVFLGSKNEDGHFWTQTDMPDCPGVDAEQLGWVNPDDLMGRVIMAIGR